MDTELEELFLDWELLEAENINYIEKKKNLAVYLILSFLNLMVYCTRFVVDAMENQKKKIDKKYYSIDDID